MKTKKFNEMKLPALRVKLKILEIKRDKAIMPIVRRFWESEILRYKNEIAFKRLIINGLAKMQAQKDERDRRNLEMFGVMFERKTYTDN